MRPAPLSFLLLLLSSCDGIPFGGAGCTAIGCVPNLSVTLQHEGGRLADGEYTLGIVADGRTSTCEFSVPPTLPDGGTQEFIRCGENGEVTVTERSQCIERTTADAVSQTCQPIPNTWHATFSISETPEELELELRLGDEPVLNETLEPTYVENFPNGPQCGGGCLQADVTLTVE